MNVKALTEVVESIVQDASVSGRILPLFNDCLNYLAGMFLLPALDTYATVDTVTGDFKVTLPDNYMKHVYHVSSTAQGIRLGGPLKGNNNPYYDFNRFLAKWPVPSVSNAGAVRDVAIKGNALWYQEVPQTPDTLGLHFYEKPTMLVEEGDSPTCLPEHLHEELLTNFALWRLYQTIEDGLEGKKVDTNHYKGQFAEAVAQLDNWVPKRGEPTYVTDDDENDAYAF